MTRASTPSTRPITVTCRATDDCWTNATQLASFLSSITQEPWPCAIPRDFTWPLSDPRLVEFIDFCVSPFYCFLPESPDTVAIPIIEQGDLIPKDEESYNHTARMCRVNKADNKLYVSMGQPFNVSPPEKQEIYNKVGIGGMIRFNRFPGKLDREVIATGIRNSVGHDFNPKDNSLWFTDNQVDGMGDETPPGELNKMPKMGMWYGHPYYGGGDVRTDDYKGKEIPKDLADRYVKPQIEMIAHAADLGMSFYNGKMFPDKYKGAIFSAQHGSWNAVKPRGARVMVTYLDAKGNATKTEPFMEGCLRDTGVYACRPMDVQVYNDGSLLVSDDKVGAVYRISYKK